MNLGNCIPINEIERNISFFDCVNEINKQNEVLNFYILFSTEVFVTSSFLHPAQACFQIFVVFADMHHSEVGGVPKLYIVRKTVPAIRKCRAA